MPDAPDAAEAPEAAAASDAADATGVLEPPERTVVTGAGGWLGRTLVHRLAADGRAVRALVQRDDAVAAELRSLPDVDVVLGDITVRADLDRLLAGTATTDVIHAAGIIHPERVRQLFDVNAGGTENVLRAAVAHGIRRVVHVSSNSPFGTNPHRNDRFRADEPFDPYLAYGRSKMMAELAVREACDGGLDAVIVRPPWFYGPRQPARQTTFFTMVRRGKFPVFGDGRQRRSMVYVDNLVEGVLLAEARGRTGHGYWIADRRPYEVIEIVRTVQEALRAEGVETKDGMMRLPALASTVAETGDRILQRLGRYQQQLHVAGEMGKTIACDISASVADLGYDPQIELLEGMRRSIRWCLDEGIEL